MQKIPVGRTIAFAYRFLFTHIGAVLGIGWFPAVLYAGAAYAARAFEMAHQTEIAAGDGQATFVSSALSVLAILVALFATSLAGIGITRQALGQRAGTPAIYFEAGPMEWRMFAANLRYSIGALALIVLASIVATVAFVLAGIPLEGPQEVRLTAAVILAALIAWFVLVYAFVTILRMGFLLAPVVLAEQKAGLKRAHDLIHGNVWRMIGVLIPLWIPTIALFAAGIVAIVRAGGGNVAGLGAEQLAQRVENAIEANLIPWTAFTALVLILWWGLFYAGAAYAYRALVPDEGNTRRT